MAVHTDTPIAAAGPTRTPNSFIVIFGTVAALFLVAMLFIMRIAFTAKPDDLEQRRAKQRVEAWQKLEAADAAALDVGGWADKTKGTVRVPIREAMSAVITELKGKNPVASAVKVEPPLPMPAPFDPNATEPPPMPLPSAPQGADTVRFAPPVEVAAPGTPAIPAGSPPSPPAVSAPLTTAPETKPPAANVPAATPGAPALPPTATAPAALTPSSPPLGNVAPPPASAPPVGNSPTPPVTSPTGHAPTSPAPVAPPGATTPPSAPAPAAPVNEPATAPAPSEDSTRPPLIVPSSTPELPK